MVEVPEGSYILVAEYFLLDLLAVALLLLKQRAGTFPVLYTVYVFATSLTFLLVLAVVVLARTLRPQTLAKSAYVNLAQVLQVALHFSLALAVVMASAIVLASFATESATGNQDRLLALMVHSSLQPPESDWTLYLGLVTAGSQALVLLLLCFFTTTSLGHAIFDALSSKHKASSGSNCLWQTTTVVAVLGLFVQTSLCAQVHDVCRHTDGEAKCELEQFSLSADKNSAAGAAHVVAFFEALAVTSAAAAEAALPGSYAARAYAAFELTVSVLASTAAHAAARATSTSNLVDKYGSAFLVVVSVPLLYVAVWVILKAWFLFLPRRLKTERSRDRLRTNMICVGALLGYGLHLYFVDDCAHTLFRTYNLVVGVLLCLAALVCVASGQESEDEETESNVLEVEEVKSQESLKMDFSAYKQRQTWQERPCLLGTKQPIRRQVYLKHKKQ